MKTSSDVKLLANKISKRTGIYQKDCERMVSVLFDEIVKDMKDGDGFMANGFGKFIYDVQHGRDVNDPVNGGLKHVPPKTNIKFIPCADLKYGVRALDWHEYLTDIQKTKDWYYRELEREKSGDS